MTTMKDKIKEIEILNSRIQELLKELEEENNKYLQGKYYVKNNTVLRVEYDIDYGMEITVWKDKQLYAKFYYTAKYDEILIYEILNDIYEYKEYDLVDEPEENDPSCYDYGE